VHAGYYTTFPTSPVAVTGGTGTGATFTLTSGEQLQAWPRTGATGYDDTEIPQLIKDAQCELAFELTQDPSLETATDASKNIRRVAAGSAEISFFKPTSGARFPTIVTELLKPLLGGASGVAGSFASGTGACAFDEDFGFTKGLP
jgi:hypothetical protein